MNIPAPFTKNQISFLNRCFSSWFNVAEGGKRGGKNVLITMAYCTILEKHPSRIHLIAGVSTATARLNILDCDGFGLLNFFEGRCRTGQYQNRDCVYINTPVGEKIVLVSGGGKAGDEKLIKGNTYGTAYITEANECSKTFIQEVFDRTISSPDRKVFHDLNPKAQGHWYYTDILDFHEKNQAENPRYGYNYGHFTIADNMSLSDDNLREALATYDKKSVWYARDILGQRKAAEGLIYPMFSPDRHVVHGDFGSTGEYYISIDYGTLNPTAMGLFKLHNGEAVMVKEYYYNGREARKQKTDEEYYQDLEDFASGYRIERVIVDPSAASFKACIFRHGKFAVWDANNSVLDGIRLTATLLQAGKLKFHESCVNTIREFGLYMWDQESQEDKVIKENDHCLTGDTLVDTVDGPVRIDNLVGKSGFVYCTDGNERKIGQFHDVRMTSECEEVFEIELENGKTVKATADHPIFTERGWIRLKDLRGDDKIACIGG